MSDALPSDAMLRHKMMATILRASIAEQVRALRIARQLSQEKLAVHLGTSQSVISGLEDPHGEWPSVQTLTRIANFFDVALQMNFATWGDFVNFCCTGAHVAPVPYSKEAASE